MIEKLREVRRLNDKEDFIKTIKVCVNHQVQPWQTRPHTLLLH